MSAEISLGFFVLDATSTLQADEASRKVVRKEQLQSRSLKSVL